MTKNMKLNYWYWYIVYFLPLMDEGCDSAGSMYSQVSEENMFPYQKCDSPS